MQEEPELVSASPGAGGAVRGQMKFVGLQQVLHAAPLAVFALIEPLRPAVGEVGDDVAGIDPVRSGFDPGNDPALALPGLGSTLEVRVAAQLEPDRRGRTARGIAYLRARFERLDPGGQGGGCR